MKLCYQSYALFFKQVVSYKSLAPKEFTYLGVKRDVFHIN